MTNEDLSPLIAGKSDSEAEIKAALLESHDRFRTLFQSMPLGVVYHQADGKIEMANQAACDILGLSREELMGLTSMDPRWRVADENGNELSGDQHPAMVALATGKPVNNMLLSVFSPRSSNHRWLLVNAVPEFRKGETVPFRAYAAFLDVTERREALESLAASEKSLRNVINATPVGVHFWHLDDNDKLIFTGANPAADRILGIDNSRFLGMELLEAFPANAGSEVPERYRDLCNGGPNWHTEQYIYQDDKITGAFDVNAFQTSHGNMAAFFMDVTDRKQAEDEKEKLIRKLESKQQELESFTNAVSHDLKSPLITIKGFLGMVNRDLENSDMDRLRSDLERINNATEKMFQIINDLLELSRIGRMDTPPVDVDLHVLVDEVLELLHGPIQENNVEIVVSPALSTAKGEPSRLHSVFQNLVENAIKFARKDVPLRIEIGVEMENDIPVYHVCDNGIGIEERYQESIFRIFNKLDADKAGAGVGLALVSRIIESHGGRIWVKSDGIGTGSCFHFTLQPAPSIFSK